MPNSFDNIKLPTIILGWKKLDKNFYERTNVVKIAQELLGKILVTSFDDIVTAGRIVETEAYNGIVDKASHAFGSRRTSRTEIMFGHGGFSYVYLCYGIHHLFNVVTNKNDVPHAILIRALEPVAGIEQMLLRTGKMQLDYSLTKGPGNVSKALGVKTIHTGIDLTGDKIFITDDNYLLKKKDVVAATRIGVDYAAEDALLPYRFYVKGNKYVSGKNLL